MFELEHDHPLQDSCKVPLCSQMWSLRLTCRRNWFGLNLTKMQKFSWRHWRNVGRRSSTTARNEERRFMWNRWHDRAFPQISSHCLHKPAVNMKLLFRNSLISVMGQLTSSTCVWFFFKKPLLLMLKWRFVLEFTAEGSSWTPHLRFQSVHMNKLPPLEAELLFFYKRRTGKHRQVTEPKMPPCDAKWWSKSWFLFPLRLSQQASISLLVFNLMIFELTSSDLSFTSLHWHYISCKLENTRTCTQIVHVSMFVAELWPKQRTFPGL